MKICGILYYKLVGIDFFITEYIWVFFFTVAMYRKARKKENHDDECLYGMKKTTYLEKYSLKHFPYPGTRRYTPLIYISLDEGVVISNDVFGLTISQFEREFKACLERRTKQEQWILNLRCPDKSSNEYIEYLQVCTDQRKCMYIFIHYLLYYRQW